MSSTTTKELYQDVETASWSSIGVIPRNVLSELPTSFSSFLNKKDNRQYKLEFQAKISKEIKEQLFSLLEDNMKTIYAESGWGWNEKKKLRELSDDEARFICIHDASDNSLIAFVHFRFLVEGYCKVLYCYELQIRKDRARLGLGKRLMIILEIIARKFKMEWVMLTVLLNNKGASHFYRGIGYIIDETSPQLDLEYDDKDLPYEILSKRLL